MSVRRRELRVRLRSDRVGHGAVIEWLDAMERDGRGVAGLQELVIEVLAAHLSRLQPKTTPIDPAATAEPVARPARGTARSAVVAIAARTDRAEDPIERAARTLEF